MNSAEKYGDLAPEVGDALMLYGKALLMNAIAQSDVLGNGGGAAKESEGIFFPLHHNQNRFFIFYTLDATLFSFLYIVY